jgi:hypothetical protein
MKLGNGRSASAWFDIWDAAGPLCNFITPRALHTAGFTLNSKVYELVHNGSWSWPASWEALFPVLLNMVAPNLSNEVDTYLWTAHGRLVQVYLVFAMHSKTFFYVMACGSKEASHSR